MKKLILLVDDEAEIRDLLTQFLTVNGYRVLAVASPTAALEAARREPPDLIISDLQLEDADGLEMITELKTVLPDKPVILLTGILFDPAVVRDVLGPKVDCYLEKTSPLARILDAIRNLIPSSSA
jgi:CheY-like chemotaxis protein